MDPELIAPQPVAAVMRRAGAWLALVCERCGHAPRVDMPAVVERYGSEITVRDLVRRARCTRCGCREVEVCIGHDGQPSWTT